MHKNLTRRQFLKLLAVAFSAGCVTLKSLGRTSLAQSINRDIFLPWVSSRGIPTATPTISPSQPIPTNTLAPTKTPHSTPSGTPGPLTGKVVHVHSESATSWDYSTGWFGDYVNQSTVSTMVDEGLKLLTSTSTVADAWTSLLPGYVPGMAIAIKVNFNNTNADCTYDGNIIDALIEPVNALIRGMKEMGVSEQDIWIYDALDRIPYSFCGGCLYPDVRFLDQGCSERATFISNDPDSEIQFNHPNLTIRRLTDVVIDAAYLINMPIMKEHGITGVTLGFKNHFGSINKIIRLGEDNLHYYINPDDSHYNPNYSPLLDIYTNPHILNKTILTVGDGLFGVLGNTNVAPTRWQSFGNRAPNSLFFSTDPVAIDCVMLDIIDSEPVGHPLRNGAQDYLKLAANLGLGIFDRGDPWGTGYTQIAYSKIEL